MKLIDMKGFGEDMGAPKETEARKPQYPYGTKLCLEGKTIDKLGIGDCEVGESVAIEGIGEVVMVSDDGSNKSVYIQIQQLGIATPDDAADKAEDKSESGKSGTLMSKFK
jgi:Major coat protein-like